ncbi:MAG: hypothetical protein RR852_19015, partial [Comamonas sp.]
MITEVQNAVDTLLGGTVAEPVIDLVNALVDPNGSTLSTITGLLENLTNTQGGLGALTTLANGLLNVEGEGLAPLIDSLNGLAAGAADSSGSGGLQNVVNQVVGGLLGAGGLGGLLGGLLTGGSNGGGDGLIASTQNIVDSLAGGTVAAPVADLVNALINPTDGTLSAVTNALESLTSADGGPLGVLTELVDGLATLPGEGLEPLIDTLNGLIGGLAGAGDGAGTLQDVVEGVLGEDAALGGLLAEGGLLAGVGDLLGSLSGGTGGGSGEGSGLVTTAQEVVDNLLGGTVAEPVASLINALTHPTDGTLATVTDALESLTNTDGGPLGVLTELVAGLTTLPGEGLAPLVETLNGLVSGLADAGNGEGALGGVVEGLLGENGALGGLLAEGGLLAGVGDLLGTLSGGTGGGSGEGSGIVTSAQDVIDNLLGGTVAEPVSNLLDALLSPTDGTLSVVTGALEDLTNTAGGPLGVLTELVNGLTQVPGEGLEPVLGVLQDLIAGISENGASQGLTDIVAGVLGDNGLLGGLLGGDGGLLSGVVG